MKLNYAHTQEYKNILKEYVSGLTELRKFMAWDTKEATVTEKMNELNEALASKYRNYLEKMQNDLDHKVTTISKRYKNTKNVYSNPQAELLKRQDFDLEFELWDDLKTLEVLEDYERDLSNYEIAKIKARYQGNQKIAMALAERMETEDNAILSNPEYAQALEESQVIRAIKNHGLEMVYIPQQEGARKEYEMYDLRLTGKKYHISDLDYKLQEMTTLIDAITPPVKTEYEELQRITRIAKVAKLKYPDFAPCIFKGSENYDITDRFKYLKERFDDTTTTRWSLDNPGYDVFSHLEFLENRHTEYMEQNPDYAELYRQAEIRAVEEHA